jgi:hypothetical protein
MIKILISLSEILDFFKITFGEISVVMIAFAARCKLSELRREIQSGSALIIFSYGSFSHITPVEQI